MNGLDRVREAVTHKWMRRSTGKEPIGVNVSGHVGLRVMVVGGGLLVSRDSGPKIDQCRYADSKSMLMY